MVDRKILGIMSGTSLDGLDLAACYFTLTAKEWSWEIRTASTIPYPEHWKRRLQGAPGLPGKELQILHQEYGQFIGLEAGSFLAARNLEVDVIASHGHTVFHQPESSFTFQIGDPQVIATYTGIRTIGDFRKLDMLLGGQGAPLVPVGDEYLFGKYGYCLNLGGIANISYREGGKRLARDICPVNLILNRLAGELGLPFDKDGKAGMSGNVCDELLIQLNAIPHYHAKGPASLGREWLESEFLPCLEGFNIPVTDALRTVYEHIAFQLSRTLSHSATALVTGGGAFNTFLIRRMRETCKAELAIPDNRLVEFKEALIFAFLALLRERNQVNCFASVTGAATDSCCGVIFRPA